MRLDVNSLEVQSFDVAGAVAALYSSDTGQGGPDSLCYICIYTGNYVPSCRGYECDDVAEPVEPAIDFRYVA
jgi:hypothetical protein